MHHKLWNGAARGDGSGRVCGDDPDTEILDISMDRRMPTVVEAVTQEGMVFLIRGSGTMAEWQEVLPKMDGLIRERALPPLTEMERQTIIRYLSSHCEIVRLSS